MNRNIDRRLITILLIVFVQMLGASMVLPILPLYAQREFEIPPQIITLLISVFFAAQFLAGPYIGRLSDQYGRVPVLVISQIGTVISFIMLGAAQSVTMLFIARILDGITGGNIIVAQAYVTDVTPANERTKSLGFIFAAFGLGFMIGPALGGVLSSYFGPTIPFFVAAVAAAIVVLLTQFTLDETLTAEEREARRNRGEELHISDIFTNQLLIVTLIITFVAQFGIGLLQSTFALYGDAVIFEGYDESTVNLGVGVLLSAVGLTQLLTQTFILPRLTKRFRDTTLIAVGVTIRAIAFVLFVFAITPLIGLFGSIFFALAMGVMMPPLQSYITTLVNDDVRGAVLGYYQSTVSLATIFSTALSGALFSLSPQTPYWIGAGLSAIVIIPILTMLRSPEPTQAIASD